MSNIDKQALREEFQYMQDHYSDPADRARQVIYIAAEALLDELDKKQQYIKLRDQENEDIALTVGKLRVELEAAKKRLAELEKGHQEAAKQINSWRRLAKQNIAERGKDISELESARQRIAEQSAIVATAEKLVRCKGRYHSELNYRALAKLFDVVTPDLPPLEHENVHYADAAEVEITALRQRIQELEAKLSKPVLLPKTNGYWTEQEKAYEEAITLAKRQVRLAGFNVEEM
ncbi:ead/Ea22-like family protein [Salmonella enterica subsp. enterica serovar Typhimurium]|uniref:ead/Ea22-like family protein n=1 Tax=Salmonella enterica TaxID=28901 RepID=UPI0007ADAC49|nr:ead/Ea22-like family protein [Salmonella enterica]EBX6970175.1 ead/Ea22-like family protein [Salmonella enterica subsp. enterica serovar Typhimurium]EDQ4557456.1 ead/Ea22-like family protein [Salmonella enterica subsp. enterica serovar 4,[5],12:i:-]EDZ6754453.1 ead/Ea22-like family protein [Salmonella enterica subsp. enterica]EFR4119299.1 ead/Ea22-like family protein [Salmonella enterica subsp. enterica serovar Brandenburg]AMZ63066.1 protein Ead [Salmonella enterica subsp. enterica serovar 